MVEKFSVKPIGRVVAEGGSYEIVLEPQYGQALAGLEHFSHVQVLWWCDGYDNPTDRKVLQVKGPYRKTPGLHLGVFASRSPARPNPLGLSTAGIVEVDLAGARLRLDYLDANHGSPVLDIKPYSPSLDRVERPRTPDWKAHWPKSLEESADFDWEAEFTE